jgi:putative chitinase
VKLEAAQLAAACECPPERAAQWLPWIERAWRCYGIDTPLRLAAFLAQANHESDGLRVLSEGMNYSADGLQATWPKRFDPATAAEYARNPERIANKVYANRMGNGDEASGDGWRYRGGGIFQLTGRDDYKQYGAAVGLDLLSDPNLIRVPGWPAAMSAAWEWDRSKINPLADAGNIDAVSKRINGGTIGLNERRRCYAVAKRALGA